MDEDTVTVYHLPVHAVDYAMRRCGDAATYVAHHTLDLQGPIQPDRCLINDSIPILASNMDLCTGQLQVLGTLAWLVFLLAEYLQKEV
jgi:hypothetical protein